MGFFEGGKTSSIGGHKFTTRFVAQKSCLFKFFFAYYLHSDKTKIVHLYSLTKNEKNDKMVVVLFLILIMHPFEVLSANEWSDCHSSEYINIHEGLPHNFIDDIVRDSRGFIWVSTAGGGLARYDGYEFVEFNKYTPVHRLKSNFVHDADEDSFGRLWVGGKDGIDLVDIYSLAPVELDKSNAIVEKIANKETYKVYCTGGEVWVSNNTGFFRVRLNGRSGDVVGLDTIFAPKGESKHVNSFLPKSDYGAPLFGYDNVVFKLTPSSDPSMPYRADTLLALPHGHAISAICQYEDRLWIGTCRGLFSHDAATGKLHRYRTSPRQGTLSQDFITDIIVHHEMANEPSLVVSTLMGFNIYRPKTDDFERVTSDTPSLVGRPLLGCNFINCLMSDDNTLWVGTEAGGIGRIYPNRLSVKNIVLRPQTPSGNNSNPVNAIHEDAKGQIWIGRVEGGLTRMDEHHKVVETYTVASPHATGLSHNSVSSLVSDSDERLWIGTWGKGVCVLSHSVGQDSTLRFHHLTTTQKGLTPRREMIRTMCYDDANRLLWIAGEHIYAYDMESGIFLQPLSTIEPRGMAVGSNGMVIDNNNLMWMVTRSGLLSIDLSAVKDTLPTFRKWESIAGLDMGEVKAAHMTVGADETVWIGTDGYGVIRITYTDWRRGHQPQFELITTTEGLIDNSVRGILEADDHTIWIATLKGISRYTPTTGQSDNFTTHDGIPASPFYANAACKGSDGTLYFGSMEGVTVISPSTVRMTTDNHKGQLAFTQVYTPERVLSTKAREVTIHEREKALNVRFSSLTYHRMPTERYAYRLQGFDHADTWHFTDGKQRSATYTNLPAGKYTLQVKYAANGNDWDTDMQELIIQVRPYFYKTWWCRLIVILSLLLAGYLLYTWRVRALKRQKRVLRKKVQEHTLTLRKQKEQLAERNEELEQKNRLLTLQNEEITRQKSEIVQMAQQQFAYSMSPDELHIPAHSPDIELLNRTLEIIKHNYSNPDFDITHIINALGVSRTLLYTKIQKLTGDSVGNLLRNYRLTMGHRLIAETQPTQSLTIAEIAYRVGFNDPKYFSRCFARQYGCPPSRVLSEGVMKCASDA